MPKSSLFLSDVQAVAALVIIGVMRILSYSSTVSISFPNGIDNEVEVPFQTTFPDKMTADINSGIPSNLPLMEFYIYSNGSRSIQSYQQPEDDQIGSITQSYIQYPRVDPEKYSFVDIAGAYIIPDYFFVNEEQKLFGYGGFCSTIKKHKTMQISHKVSHHFDLVMAFGNSHNSVFGHFIPDCLSLVSLFPPSVISSAHFIFKIPTKFSYELLSTFGVPTNHIHCTPENTLVHANHAIFPVPRPCLLSPLVLLSKVRSRILDNFSVENSLPTYYAIYNRVADQRVISNVLELIEDFQSMTNLGCWVLIGDLPTIKEAVELYHSTAIHFSLHGSVFPNLLFMQNGTVAVEFRIFETYTRKNTGYRDMCLVANLFYLVSGDRSIYRQNQNVSIPIFRSHVIVKRALEISEGNKTIK